jgi:hypothetical protein
VSDAAVDEVQLLFEMYEHFQLRLVVKKRELCLTLPIDLIEMANLFAFLCDVAID